jgi:hypothetical protein
MDHIETGNIDLMVELCRLIARLDLPLSIADTNACNDYIQHTHNPRNK